MSAAKAAAPAAAAPRKARRWRPCSGEPQNQFFRLAIANPPVGRSPRSRRRLAATLWGARWSALPRGSRLNKTGPGVFGPSIVEAELRARQQHPQQLTIGLGRPVGPL